MITENELHNSWKWLKGLCSNISIDEVRRAVLIGSNSVKFLRELIFQNHQFGIVLSLTRVLISGASEGAVCLNWASTVLMGLHSGNTALLPAPSERRTKYSWEGSLEFERGNINLRTKEVRVYDYKLLSAS